jgi:hypothetical protein
MNVINSLLVAQNATQPNSGSVQWEAIPGGISRSTLEDSFKIMPSISNNHLEVNTVLINNVTIREVMKFGRDEMGGDMSQEIFKNGWTDVDPRGLGHADIGRREGASSRFKSMIGSGAAL